MTTASHPAADDDAPAVPPSSPTVAPAREPEDAPAPGDPDLVPPGTMPE